MPDAKAAGWSGTIIGHQDTDNAWDVLASAVKDSGQSIQSLAIEKSHMTVERLEAITKDFLPFKSIV